MTFIKTIPGGTSQSLVQELYQTAKKVTAMCPIMSKHLVCIRKYMTLGPNWWARYDPK